MIDTQSVVHEIMFRHCRHTDLFAVAVVYRHTYLNCYDTLCMSLVTMTGLHVPTSLFLVLLRPPAYLILYVVWSCIGSVDTNRSLWRPLRLSVVWDKICC